MVIFIFVTNLHCCVDLNAAIPRQNIVRDIFGYVKFGHLTPFLLMECPDLLSIKPMQQIQVPNIRAVSIFRCKEHHLHFIAGRVGESYPSFITSDPKGSKAGSAVI